MTARTLIDALTQHEQINFVLTNRIPRRLVTRAIAWISRVEHPLVRVPAMALWQMLAGDLRLHEARRSHFRSLHDCFIRDLKTGARPIAEEPDILVSPCDGIVVSCGAIDGTTVVQAKGSVYSLEELLCDESLAAEYRGGCYVTLRLTSNLYHRFHAPADCHVAEVVHVAGETWNVNPIALKRIERLYCKNERAVVHARLPGAGRAVALVPVAAILVGNIVFNFIDDDARAVQRGVHHIPCDVRLRKGEEMGRFELGSTIVVLATPGIGLCDHIHLHAQVQMGQPLLRHSDVSR